MTMRVQPTMTAEEERHWTALVRAMREPQRSGAFRPDALLDYWMERVDLLMDERYGAFMSESAEIRRRRYSWMA